MKKATNILYYLWGYLAVVIVSIHFFYRNITRLLTLN